MGEVDVNGGGGKVARGESARDAGDVSLEC